MAQVRQWKVKLTLEGPVLTQATSAGSPGLDALMARTPDGGAWCLPGTHVKGRLRQAWEELDGACGWAVPVGTLLGKEAANPEGTGTGSVDPARGVLHFTDFVCTSHSIPAAPGPAPAAESGASAGAESGEPEAEPAEEQGAEQASGPSATSHGPAETLFRVRMDAERGSVDRGAYLVMEAPFAVGEKVVFEGTVRTVADGSVFSTEEVERWLRKGFAWIPAFGAERTVGFGRLTGITVEAVGDTGTEGRFGNGDEWFFLDPLEAFCIARPKVASNLFEAEEVIPGGVIKGCLAAAWAQALGEASSAVGPGFDKARPELSEHFWAVRFTHAFPCGADGKRAVVFPQSLVQWGDGSFKDVALGPDPYHTPNFDTEFGGRAPAFSVDWKGKAWGAVTRHFGWPDLKKDLRVRTAMDPASRKGADEKLFAVETVVPGHTRWKFRIDLSRVPDTAREKVAQQLKELLGLGLLGLGKTKAAARIESTGEGSRMASSLDPIDGKWIVTLQTPALLGDPSELGETSGADALKKIYEAEWHDLSGGLLQLSDYFARQRLAGGYYLHRRFRDGQDYRPYLLTEAGSVFVLQAADGIGEAEAKEAIKNLLDHGLPPPQWVRALAAETKLWQHCPYLPENGYGEIAVNLPVHRGEDVPGGGDA